MRWIITILNKFFGKSKNKTFNKSDVKYTDGDNT